MTMYSTLSILAQTTPPNQGVDHQTLLIWAIVLMGVAIVAAIVEVFVPTGGLLGLLAGASAITSIVLFFWFNETTGVIALIAALIMAPIIIGFGLKVMPHTPLVRLMILEEDETSGAATGQRNDTEGPAIGAEGLAVTDLRPVGTCTIDGQRLDCLAVGPQIERGQAVTVIGRSGPQWRVKRAT